MSSKDSLGSFPSSPRILSSLNPVQTALVHDQPAYMQSVSSGSPESLSQYYFSSNISPAQSGTYRATSTLNYEFLRHSGHTSGTLDHDFHKTLRDLPPSSTPDLLSPDSASPSSSDVPLTQKNFVKRLHARLQNVLDQQQKEHDSGGEDSSSYSLQEDYESVEESQQDRDEYQKSVHWVEGDSCSSSDRSSEEHRSLESPREEHIFLGVVYGRTPLTHRNKRKHDFTHGSLNRLTSDEEATDVDDGEPLPNRKKTKVGAGSTVSISTTFSYQTSETASSRKFRSLNSTTSSFSSTDSTVVTSPLTFVHPIIHPPSSPLNAPKSRPEVAEARLKQLLKREASYRTQDGLPSGSFRPIDVSSDEGQTVFGIEPDFRRNVVEWILDASDVISPRYLNSQDLYRHLKYSEETRFHAIYLFTRFFLRMAECGARPGALETKAMRAARLETTWDVAFCCLAISTKFYHDFLHPLNPICSRHFLAIAPQMLGHDQFERIQRDVLEAFDYEVHGITPHAFFEELWDALPSLRELLRFRRTRVKTRDEMWDMLQLAVLECDIMCFPVSLLTAAALIESVLITLVYEYEKQQDDDVDLQSARLKKNCNTAREEIKTVTQDISRLLGTTADDLDTCRRWLAAITIQ